MSVLSASPPPSPSPDPLAGVPVVQPTCVSAVLVPVGVGLGEGAVERVEFGQCLCVDWFPGNREGKVAAGFSNGMVST